MVCVRSERGRGRNLKQNKAGKKMKKKTWESKNKNKRIKKVK